MTLGLVRIQGKAIKIFLGLGAAGLGVPLGKGAREVLGNGTPDLGNLNPLSGSTPPIQTSNFWDIMLLLVSLGLVAIGSQIGTRGPVYVGAIGLVLFLLIAGLDVNNTPPHPFKFGIWPWVLLVGGLIGLGLSFSREASLGDQPRRFIQNLRGR